MTVTDDLNRTILLVNTAHNPDAKIDKSDFIRGWNWFEAPLEWKAEDGMPVNLTGIDAVIVFSRKYAEQEALLICKSIRDCDEFNPIPLLVAITMYQMPLGNDVKRLPNAGFILFPIKEQDLLKRLNEMARDSG